MNGPSSTALIGWLWGVKPGLNVFAVYTNMKLEILSILKVRTGLCIRNFKMTLFFSWHHCFCYYAENRLSYILNFIYSKSALLYCLLFLYTCGITKKVILFLTPVSFSSYCLPDNLWHCYFSFFSSGLWNFDAIFLLTGHGFRPFCGRC